MRILHVITRLILGGAQKNTVMSCIAQQQAGHDVTLAAGRTFGPEGSLVEEAAAAGVAMVTLDPLVRQVAPMSDWRAYRAIRKLVADLAPDVVHTHSSKAGIVGRAAAWSVRRSRQRRGEGPRPVVIHTVHGLPFHAKQPAWIYWPYVWAERDAAKRCDHLIAITDAMRDAFLAHRIGREDQFTIIPSGVDATLFNPVGEPGAADYLQTQQQVRRELGINPAAPVIGLVARYDPLKGHDDLLRAMPTILARHPDAHLLFIGGGWGRDAVQRRVDELGLTDRVTMTGLVPMTSVPRLLHAMDVSVLPSHQEGQSRTLVESLMCGVAIVAYDVGGIGQVCIDGVTGRLVPRGDTGALADAINWMLDHPQQRQALAQAGRRHALAHFDASVMVREIDQLYHRLLNQCDQP